MLSSQYLRQNENTVGVASELKRHLVIGGSTIAIGLAIVAFLAVDRATPIVFIDGELEQSQVKPGQHVVAHLIARYDRVCDGEVHRDIVGSDNVIHTYKKHPADLPLHPGVVSVEMPFRLPANLPEGQATYQAKLIFYDCGLTSRILPLQVMTPKLAFQVENAPAVRVPSSFAD